MQTILKLSTLEKRILVAAQHNVLDPLPALSRASGARPHQIHYCLEKFAAAGILVPRVVLDVTKLGDTEYSIALNVIHENEKGRVVFREFLTTHPRVVAVLLVGGKYDYMIVLASKNSQQTLEFLREIAQIRGTRILGKDISTRVGSTIYRRTVLAQTKGQKNFLTYGETGARVELDAVDRRIVNAMLPMNFRSFRELARSLEMAHSSLNARIQAMVKNKLIVGYAYGLYTQRLGLHVYRVLIATAGLDLAELESFRKFCLKHPNIETLVETVGSWDFELLIEVPDAEQSRNVVQDVYQLLPGRVIRIELVTVFRYLRAHFGGGFQAIEQEG